jgi:hypothetical protein
VVRATISSAVRSVPGDRCSVPFDGRLGVGLVTCCGDPYDHLFVVGRVGNVLEPDTAGLGVLLPGPMLVPLVAGQLAWA